MQIFRELLPPLMNLFRVFIDIAQMLFTAFLPIILLLSELILENIDIIILFVNAFAFLGEMLLWLEPIISLVAFAFEGILFVVNWVMDGIRSLIDFLTEALAGLLNWMASVADALGLDTLKNDLRDAADALEDVIVTVDEIEGVTVEDRESEIDIGEMPTGADDFNNESGADDGAEFGTVSPEDEFTGGVSPAGFGSSVTIEEININIGTLEGSPEEFADIIAEQIAEEVASQLASA